MFTYKYFSAWLLLKNIFASILLLLIKIFTQDLYICFHTLSLYPVCFLNSLSDVRRWLFLMIVFIISIFASFPFRSVQFGAFMVHYTLLRKKLLYIQRILEVCGRFFFKSLSILTIIHFFPSPHFLLNIALSLCTGLKFWEWYTTGVVEDIK